MKNILLALVATSLILTGCKKDKENNADSPSQVISVSKEEDTSEKLSSKKTEEKTPEPSSNSDQAKQAKGSDQDQGIFKDLEGKGFIACMVDSGERLYFHENGSFDGAMFYGDGTMMTGCLLKGRFEEGAKVDDYTYELKLADISYQTPTSGTVENLPYTLRYGKSFNFDKAMVGDTYYLHLPGTSIKSLDEKGILYQLDYNENVSDGIVNMYMISKNPFMPFEDSGQTAFMCEEDRPDYIQAKAGADHVFEDLVYNGVGTSDTEPNESTSSSNTGQAGTGFKKSQGINISKSGFLDHATQIEMANRIITNYRQNKENATGEAKDHKGGLALVDTGSWVLFNLYEAEGYEDHLDNKTLSDLDKAKEKPIIKVLGNIIDEKSLKPTGEGFNDTIINEYTMEASTRNGEPILIKLDFVGDIDTATFVDENGVETVKAWAIPLGEYRIDHPSYGNIRVLEFAAGEGTQALANKVYGQSYGF